MSAARAALLLLLVACAGGDKGGGGGDPGDSLPRETDANLLQAAIDGTRDPAVALATIAAQGGLPVDLGGGTFRFACLCGEGDWALAGDHDGWAGAPMNRAGDLWWIDAAIPEPDGSLYKFVNGEDYIADPLGRRYGFDEFGQYSLVAASAPHLERWYGVAGFGLVARALQVWLPQDGLFTHALYAHDGQNLFDPGAFYGGWQLDQSLPPDILVVGIDNTVDRMEEYTVTTDTLDGEVYGGAGDAYLQLVSEVIRPQMEAAYGPAAVVGTMGSSLGGLISFELAHAYEGQYDMAISLSGTMGWGSIEQHEETVIDRYRAAGHRGTALYLDSGGGGEACADSDGDGVMDDDPNSSDNYCENIQLRDVLADAGYQFDVDLFHWWEPGAPHNEAAWAARVGRPLALFAAR